ncbi:protein NnrT [Salibaculum griseiflavum]|uniref:Protein NnrT n=1 Tax=Salibaculum griseiflavum TaxID=1914409 RepID=A0A2V1P4H2_9RHOB|nr:protein NnrT [Salibaculum griseiflavum]PWG16700.1 protein NnrT [Salibaculum griseiflavum]
MRHLMIPLTTLLASPVLAEGFDRPIPQAQSATAEFWYALACLALVAAMIAVHRLVARR